MYRAAALIAVCASCQSDVATPYPPGLMPFPDDDEPAGLAADIAEKLVTAAHDDSTIKVYGRGYILALPDVVFAAAHDPTVMFARCATTSQTVMPNNEPEYDLSFLVHYFVDDILDVEWDDQWRGGVITRDPDGAPTGVIVKHQKVQGSDFITTSEGTIELFAVDFGPFTEVRFVEHLDALAGSPDDVTRGMTDNYGRLVAAVHQQPAPSCTR